MHVFAFKYLFYWIHDKCACMFGNTFSYIRWICFSYNDTKCDIKSQWYIGIAEDMVQKGSKINVKNEEKFTKLPSDYDNTFAENDGETTVIWGIPETDKYKEHINEKRGCFDERRSSKWTKENWENSNQERRLENLTLTDIFRWSSIRQERQENYLKFCGNEWKWERGVEGVRVSENKYNQEVVEICGRLLTKKDVVPRYRQNGKSASQLH